MNAKMILPRTFGKDHSKCRSVLQLHIDQAHEIKKPNYCKKFTKKS